MSSTEQILRRDGRPDGSGTVAPYRRPAGDLVVVDPQFDPLWRKLVERYDSSVFHSPAWMSVLSATYGFDLRALVAVNARRKPIAGIPLVWASDSLGERIVCLPFSDHCDPLVEDADGWNLLAGRLLSEGCPILIRCLHSEIPLLDGRFAVDKVARWHAINLQPELDSVWYRFDDSARQAIRRAEQQGVVVRPAQTEEEMWRFSRLHLNVRKAGYRLLSQPYRFFQNLWRILLQRDKGVLMLAIHQDKMLGGTIFLEWKDTLYYHVDAFSPDGLLYRPSDLVVWQGVQYAKAKGYRRLDLGVSDGDQEEMIRFKRKYASEEKMVSFLNHGRDEGQSPHARDLQRLFSTLVGLFTDESVPDSLTDKASEALYRYLF